jgi:serine protease
MHTAQQAEQRERYVPGEVVVRFRPDISEATMGSICAREQVSIVSKGQFMSYHLLGLPANLSVEDAARRFSSLNEVEFAESNYLYQPDWYPNDPLYWNYQWNLQRSGVLDMQLAWELTTGSNSVTVAVLDQGVAYEDYDIPSYEHGEVYSSDGRYHRAPDLAGIQFVEGYDCVNNDDHPNDEGGHGTHVTGTIAQSTNNSLGAAGMAYGCKIMPVRVLGLTGGTNAQIADGITYAWQNGARVLNMSLGGQDSSHLMHLAIVDASNAGAIVVAAAGNDGHNRVSYPAAYGECIAVGAVDWWWNKAPYSNWGAALDVVAPGGDLDTSNYWPIYQNTFADAEGGSPHDVSSFDYLPFQGTSMASPHVSALVAMMMSRGIRNPAEIKTRLYGSAVDLGDAGWDTLYGRGLIEPVAALGGAREFLSSDNAYPDAYWYMNNSGAEFAVACVPGLSPVFNVTEASALVRDDGVQRQFRLTVNPISGGMPDLSTNIAGPVTATTVGDGVEHWYTWDFPGVPLSNGNPYFVVFHWNGSVQPRVGGDSSPSQIYNRSYYYTPSGGWTHTSSNNWYLRAINLKDTLTAGIEEPTYSSAPICSEGIIRVRPQPAWHTTTISYTVARAGQARVEVLDCAGRIVRKLTTGQSSAGRHDVVWNGADERGEYVPGGVYFVQLKTSGASYCERVVLLK